MPCPKACHTAHEQWLRLSGHHCQHAGCGSSGSKATGMAPCSLAAHATSSLSSPGTAVWACQVTEPASSIHAMCELAQTLKAARGAASCPGAALQTGVLHPRSPAAEGGQLCAAVLLRCCAAAPAPGQPMPQAHSLNIRLSHPLLFSCCHCGRPPMGATLLKNCSSRRCMSVHVTV